MQFSARQLQAPGSSAEVTLTLHHVGKLPTAVMGHNWVLTRSSDASAVANLGPAAGLRHDFLPGGDARVLATTKLIGGGQTVAVTFSTVNLKPDEDCTYFCSAPGHIAVMKRKFLLRR